MDNKNKFLMVTSGLRNKAKASRNSFSWNDPFAGTPRSARVPMGHEHLVQDPPYRLHTNM